MNEGPINPHWTIIQLEDDVNNGKYAVWVHATQLPLRQEPFTLEEAAEKLEIDVSDLAFCIEEYGRCDDNEYVVVPWGEKYPGAIELE